VAKRGRTLLASLVGYIMSTVERWFIASATVSLLVLIVTTTWLSFLPV
jgi:hypothetical protein